MIATALIEGALSAEEPLAIQIKRILVQRIVTNVFRPGERISENEVSAGLGVSRQPVRDALIRLSEAGLVRALPQRGTEVSRIDLNSVNSGRFLREAAELAVIRDAALRASGKAIADMSDIIAAQEDAVRREDHAAFLAMDDELHAAFAASIGHGDVWRSLQNVKLQMDRVRYLSLPDATPGKLLIQQHRHIVAALRARDPARAEQAMLHHLSEVLASLPRLVGKMPDYFEQSAARA